MSDLKRQTMDYFKLDLSGKMFGPPTVHIMSTLRLITDADAFLLKVLAKDCLLAVEVGTYTGASAEALLSGMPVGGHLICVDTFDPRCSPVLMDAHDRESVMPRSMTLACLFNRFEGKMDRLTVMVATSANAAVLLKPGIADLIFLDAAHDYANVMADIGAWLPILNPKGIMVGHDWDRNDLSPKAIRDAMYLESGPEGIHCGVISAVSDSFSEVFLPPGENSLWVAKPKWARKIS